MFPVYYSSPHFFHWVFWYFNKLLWALCILEIVTFVIYYNFFNLLTNFVHLNSRSHWLHSQILLPLSLSFSLCWHSHHFPLLLGLPPHFFLISFLHLFPFSLISVLNMKLIDQSILLCSDSPWVWRRVHIWISGIVGFFKLPVTQTLDNHSHS